MFYIKSNIWKNMLFFVFGITTGTLRGKLSGKLSVGTFTDLRKKRTRSSSFSEFSDPEPIGDGGGALNSDGNSQTQWGTLAMSVQVSE